MSRKRRPVLRCILNHWCLCSSVVQRSCAKRLLLLNFVLNLPQNYRCSRQLSVHFTCRLWIPSPIYLYAQKLLLATRFLDSWRTKTHKRRTQKDRSRTEKGGNGKWLYAQWSMLSQWIALLRTCPKRFYKRIRYCKELYTFLCSSINKNLLRKEWKSMKRGSSERSYSIITHSILHIWEIPQLETSFNL